MAKRVLALERSPLSRNVYKMILSQLDFVEMDVEEEGSLQKYRDDLKRRDLLILGHATVVDRKKEIFEELKEIFRETNIPVVLFVKENEMSKWKEFGALKNVTLLERPFLPNDFLLYVKKVWGVV